MTSQLRSEVDYCIEGETVTFTSRFYDAKDRVLSTVTSASENDFVLMHGRMQLTLMKQLGLAGNPKAANEDVLAYEWLMKQPEYLKDLYFKDREINSIRPYQFRIKHK
jgi:hypothetical protein